MNKFFKSAALWVGLFGGIGLGASASAFTIVQPTTTTYYMSANCTDCASFANQATFGVTAEITLQNYIEGTAIATENLVSLVYNGSNLVDAFSITASGNDGNAATVNDYFISDIYIGVTGNISTVPGGNDFNINGFVDGLFFHVASNGAWSLCAPKGDHFYGSTSCFQNIPSDLGNNAVLALTPTNPTAVPEPAMLALMLGALGVMGMVRRRKNV